jgi:glycosyltransferase involved in cell wall biosynthesis
LETTRPLISLVIPTFNSEKFIDRCLASLVAQRTRCFEVILHDAVSSDRTLEIIDTYTKLHSFIHVFSEPDDGIYDAMNKSVLKAKGSWLFFLGSDDFLIDQNVTSQLEKTIMANPNAQMIYGDVMNRSLGRKSGGRYGGAFDEVRILRQNICHQGILYRREILENEMYQVRYKIYADYALNLRLMLDIGIAKVYTPLVIANFTEGGLSNDPTKDLFFYKEFSTLVSKRAKVNFHLYRRKIKFLTTFFHKVNKLDGLMSSLRICKEDFNEFKRYAYPSFFFTSIRYFGGFYFLKKNKR